LSIISCDLLLEPTRRTHPDWLSFDREHCGSGLIELILAGHLSQSRAVEFTLDALRRGGKSGEREERQTKTGYDFDG
jgi:hypothetical protein